MNGSDSWQKRQSYGFHRMRSVGARDKTGHYEPPTVLSHIISTPTTPMRVVSLVQICFPLSVGGAAYYRYTQLYERSVPDLATPVFQVPHCIRSYVCRTRCTVVSPALSVFVF